MLPLSGTDNTTKHRVTADRHMTAGRHSTTNCREEVKHLREKQHRIVREMAPTHHNEPASFRDMTTKKEASKPSWLSLVLVGLIASVVLASGYIVYKMSDATSDAGSTDSTAAAEAQRDGSDALAEEYTRRASSGAGRIQTSTLHRSNRVEFDDSQVWGKAPWDEVEQDAGAPDKWTPKGVATLDAQGLLAAVKDERNPGARKKLTDEMLRRDVSTGELAAVSPAAVVDVIAKEPNSITRARLADQLREREMADDEREDSAVELLLMPDGNLKLTAMEMLVQDPVGAVAQLEARLAREDQAEKLEVLQGAVEFLKRRAANGEEN